MLANASAPVALVAEDLGNAVEHRGKGTQINPRQHDADGLGAVIQQPARQGIGAITSFVRIFSTVCRISGLTKAERLMTRDTVEIETPDMRATSLIFKPSSAQPKKQNLIDNAKKSFSQS